MTEKALLPRKRRTAHQVLLAIFVLSAMPLAANGCSSCKKPVPPAEDAAAPPAVDANLDLTPLDDDAGDADTDANEGGHTWTGTGGPGLTDFQKRIQACCALIANQAAHSPNGAMKFQLQNASNVCFAFATSAASDPQLAQARALASSLKVNCP